MRGLNKRKDFLQHLEIKLFLNKENTLDSGTCSAIVRQSFLFAPNRQGRIFVNDPKGCVLCSFLSQSSSLSSVTESEKCIGLIARSHRTRSICRTQITVTPSFEAATALGTSKTGQQYVAQVKQCKDGPRILRIVYYSETTCWRFHILCASIALYRKNR